MEQTLDEKRRTFLWLCGWTCNDNGLWTSPKGTERVVGSLGHAVLVQFRRNEESLLDMTAGHAWDWAARYEELWEQYLSLRERILVVCGSAAVLADTLEGDETR